ncbi:MAG: Lipopolysaccharide core heptosyltransferase RfaQ [Verrucomicrobia subdivision 3 bacterium]|nr:Lipopolysaccharide core heptosyltransferase RfaQ [Limisphaerales bacterium]MCS1416590.1 Lipopolysaccharide core heptosyltransferase RfaQ [Limisphaerales bacterium]
MKKLLVTEFWGVGDLAIGSAFLKAANREYQVTLLAKPHAVELGQILWPKVKVIPVAAPWTRFRGKYRLHHWPWPTLQKTLRQIRQERPDIAVSARWDPRDHAVLFLSGAKRRIGFPRKGSQLLLSECLPHVSPDSPRTAQWNVLGKALELTIEQPTPPTRKESGRLAIIHSGAAQPVRIWPITRYASVASELRKRGWETTILCDPGQVEDWKSVKEPALCLANLTELLSYLKKADVFIGNDSGPGHLAAALGTPTFTIFGSQRPEWFLPNHLEAGWIEGKTCPYKPCFDYCRFPTPNCLLENTTREVTEKLQTWIKNFE